MRGAERGGVLVTNDYDAFGNVVRTRRSFADGFDTRQIAYGYDKLDRQTTITGVRPRRAADAATVFREAFSTVIDYDAFGNQTELTYGVYLPEQADAGYDAAKAALAHPLAATFDYDKLDRLASTTDGVDNTIAYESDIHGNRTSQTTGSGTADARTRPLLLRPGRPAGAPRDAGRRHRHARVRRGRQPDAEAHAAERHREHARARCGSRSRSPTTATAA